MILGSDTKCTHLHVPNNVKWTSVTSHLEKTTKLLTFLNVY